MIFTIWKQVSAAANRLRNAVPHHQRGVRRCQQSVW